MGEPYRQRQLMASLADAGQQMPIIVVPDKQDSGRYVVIDGYKRIAALEQLRQDTVEATVWAMSEAEALLPESSLRFSPAGVRARAGMAAVGDGAAFRLPARRAGAPLRPQHELGVTAPGFVELCRKPSSSKCARGRWRRRQR
jgi:hypothetical protein